MSKYFDEIKVNIKTDDGLVLSDALVSKLCNELAITMIGFGYFTVTHIPTGLKISGVYERVNFAILILVEWILIGKTYDIDWEREDATKIFSEIKDKPVPFQGATSTQNGKVTPLSIMEWVTV